VLSGFAITQTAITRSYIMEPSAKRVGSFADSHSADTVQDANVSTQQPVRDNCRRIRAWRAASSISRIAASSATIPSDLAWWPHNLLADGRTIVQSVSLGSMPLRLSRPGRVLGAAACHRTAGGFRYTLVIVSDELRLLRQHPGWAGAVARLTALAQARGAEAQAAAQQHAEIYAGRRPTARMPWSRPWPTTQTVWWPRCPMPSSRCR
jgi:hypothetical protein